DHQRRNRLEVALFTRLQIEHPGNERTFEPRSQPHQHVETRARELDAALEVDYSQPLAQLPVRQRLEAELARPALAAHDSVLSLALADRNGGTRQVAHAKHPQLELPLNFGQLVLARGYSFAQCPHLGASGLALVRRGLAQFSRLARAAGTHLVQLVL